MSEPVTALRPGGRGGQASPIGGASAFDRSVAALLERIEYRRCESGEDIEDIYRLRYKAYRAHDLVDEISSASMRDVLDDTPNCYRFGVYLDDELISTVRLHHVSREQPYSPSMTVFGDLLAPRLERGESFIDPGRLAVDPEIGSSIRVMPYITLRLAVIANSFFDTTSCICMIREEHQAFYRRIFNSEQVATPRPYASVNVMAILYESNCAQNLESIYQRFPFFRATALEQRMLFAKPRFGELAPLTILPSNRYRLRAAA
ncbi:MAG: hypothetical protein AB7I79_02335 [Rhizobiaceae bacterium]